MDSWDADLHIHSPHSIAVSKTLNLDTITETALKKGLRIIGTGDITQPAWRKYMGVNLERKNGTFAYKGVYFFIQVELEDSDSIHHVVLLPSLESAEELVAGLRPKTKDIDGEWAGRPHVHLTPAEVVELVAKVGGLIGPAHAFTPFKSIFRQGRYKTLHECFEGAEKQVSFLELGLSADTHIADQLSCLANVTFLSNSDAHSQGPQSLGRECNRLEIDSPTFDELADVMGRKNQRRVSLNIGLDPRLGKYYLMFCKTCRRRVLVDVQSGIQRESKFTPSTIQGGGKEKPLFPANKYSVSDIKYSINDKFITYIVPDPPARRNLLETVGRKKVACPACTGEKKGVIQLGVSERLELIADQPPDSYPPHRPPYLDIIPLVEIIRAINGVKSTSAASVTRIYNQLISKLGPEYRILADVPVETIKREDETIGTVIDAFRQHQITFISGGGGTFGTISLPEFE